MKYPIIPYRPYLKALARQLRNNSTLAEVLLWNELKNKQLGYDFDRQKPLDAFIVNFYCQALRLAIEVDGNSRDYNEAADVARQQRLEQLGIWFLRVTDKEVKTDMGNVLRTITAWLENHGSKTHP